MKKKKEDIMLSALKAVRRDNRAKEIALYGKTINYNKVADSKIRYTRKQKHKGNNIY